MLDPKPVGAFLEYTMKPILDQARDVLELCKKVGLKPKHVLSFGFRIMIFQLFFNLITTLFTVSLICYTALSYLNNIR